MAKAATDVLGPGCTDYINQGETMKDIFTACGFPANDIQDDKMVAMIQQKRNKVQEEERMAENAPKLARAAASMQKASEKGSPMAALTGGGGEGNG